MSSSKKLVAVGWGPLWVLELWKSFFNKEELACALWKSKDILSSHYPVPPLDVLGSVGSTRYFTRYFVILF